MSKYKFNIGDVFGSYTVIDNLIVMDSHRDTFVLCKCVCGSERKIRVYRLVNNKVNKCKDCSSYKGLDMLSGSYLSRVKQRAIRKNIDFNINIEDMYSMFLLQKGKCGLSGVSIILDKGSGGRKKGLSIQTASLDRIDSSKGYVKGNIQWVHKDINLMKNVLGEEYFIQLCKKVAKYYDNTKNENNK